MQFGGGITWRDDYQEMEKEKSEHFRLKVQDFNKHLSSHIPTSRKSKPHPAYLISA